VLCDQLLERGDPRGELIALQSLARPLTVAEARRERALVDAHGAAWCAPIAHLVVAARFARGFLAAVRARGEPCLAAHAGDPVWATVEELELVHARRGVAAALARDDAMRSLRALAGVAACDAPAIAAAGARLTWLGIDGGGREPAAFAWLANGATEGASRLARCASSITEARVDCDGWRITFTRDERGRARIDARARGGTGEDLARLLARVHHHGLAALTVGYGQGARFDLRPITDELKRFRHLEDVRLPGRRCKRRS
jgi:hypothetical protein